MADVHLPDGVTIVGDAEDVVVKLAARRVAAEEEEAPAAEEGEAETGEEAAEES